MKKVKRGRGRPKGPCKKVSVETRFLNFCGGVRKCCPKVVIDGNKVHAFDSTGTITFERQDIMAIAEALK